MKKAVRWKMPLSMKPSGILNKSVALANLGVRWTTVIHIVGKIQTPFGLCWTNIYYHDLR